MAAQPGIGTTRNLTEVFFLLRNNAQQNRFVHSHKPSRRTVPVSAKALNKFEEEEMSLVSLEESREESQPDQPMWIHTADEVEFEIGRTRTRIDELASAQMKHLSRPGFGDETFEAVEERRIQGMTEKITSMISHTQKLINMITSEGARNERVTETRLRENVTNALLYSLSQLIQQFKKHQTEYLGRIRKRTQNVDAFLITGIDDDAAPEGFSLLDSAPTSEYSMEQVQHMMLNDQFVKEREKEVLAVNSSIVELNSLFKDLSTMVIDQGTILDRIDYNVEMSSMRVTKAVESVSKAERHQRADKKMHCIMCLSISIIVVLLLIVIFKI